MIKTKELTVSGEEMRIIQARNRVTVVIENPEVNDMLMEIKEEDLASFIQWNGNKPEDVFDEKSLHKWAEDNGYKKSE